MKRKIFLFIMSSSLLLFPLLNYKQTYSFTKEDHKHKTIRIGYQKNGQLVILKSLGTLEDALEPLGYTVEWKEFQSGPMLVEALNAGSIDVGRTGNTPAIFAQAAGASIVFLAAGKPKFLGSGILVPKDSPIQSVADLKNKTIGFAKGSSSHYLLLKALEDVGLNVQNITPAFLQPGDARIAFEQGKIDAMVVWDPYTASTEINSKGKMLTNGEGLSSDRDFFVATEKFASNHQEVTGIFIEYVEKYSKWANNNHDALVSMLAPILHIDKPTIERMVKRREYGIDEMSDEIIQEQQDIADIFYELNIIPKQINVEDAMKK